MTRGLTVNVMILQIIDTNMNMNKVITDHEWHGLILKAKGTTA
jgi:hypothetical protein